MWTKDEYECGLKTDKLSIKYLIYADDQVILAPSACGCRCGVLIPTLMYGRESWVWQRKNENRINAVEMRSLRSMRGVSQDDRCRNSDVREWCDLKKDVVSRVQRGILRWFGHLEWMNESKLTKQIYKANVCDGKIGKGVQTIVCGNACCRAKRKIRSTSLFISEKSTSTKQSSRFLSGSISLASLCTRNINKWNKFAPGHEARGPLGEAIGGRESGAPFAQRRTLPLFVQLYRLHHLRPSTHKRRDLGKRVVLVGAIRDTDGGGGEGPTRPVVELAHPLEVFTGALAFPRTPHTPQPAVRA
ncbi:hypothetical protein EVAR_86550_1 [Eumeta japonica]|uniref:Reverse transcriptase domain-containing protein n=1 Tax=Eumeta variegata TaxID=151549 RepID=A0A4C1ZK19_EUMVA|nr:hypothetical protein EVAR_86550_1 [Eumeta japonica]